MEPVDYLPFFTIINQGLVYSGPRATNKLEAFNISIAKWTVVSQSKIPIHYGLGTESCGLCHLYNSYAYVTLKECKGCPVSKYTKSIWCQGTPYKEYINLVREGADIEQLQKIARNEFDFLEMLKKQYLEEVIDEL